MASPSADDEIMRLIKDTNDPQSKALLVVLLRISRNLSDNTQLTRSLNDTLSNHQKHVAEYMENGNKLINRGIGAWKAIAALSVVVYAFGAYVVANTLNDLSQARKRNDEQDIEISIIKTRLNEHLQQTRELMK